MLGAVYNLTGGQASLDQPSWNGAKLAAAQINAAGGLLGRPLHLLVADGKTDATALAAASTQLLERKVSALFGLSDTNAVLAAAPPAAAQATLFLTSGATSPKLPEQVPIYLYLACFGDNDQAAAGAEYAHETLKAAARPTSLSGQHLRLHRRCSASTSRRASEQDGVKSYCRPTTPASGRRRRSSAQIAAAGAAERVARHALHRSATGRRGDDREPSRNAGIAAAIVGGDSYDTVSLSSSAIWRMTYYTTHALLASPTRPTPTCASSSPTIRRPMGILPRTPSPARLRHGQAARRHRFAAPAAPRVRRSSQRSRRPASSAA
jgi:branched-chain amino acid transport system substrate-binding protein